jgi:hypothetical protein
MVLKLASYWPAAQADSEPPVGNRPTAMLTFGFFDFRDRGLVPPN